MTSHLLWVFFQMLRGRVHLDCDGTMLPLQEEEVMSTRYARLMSCTYPCAGPGRIHQRGRNEESSTDRRGETGTERGTEWNGEGKETGTDRGT